MADAGVHVGTSDRQPDWAWLPEAVWRNILLQAAPQRRPVRGRNGCIDGQDAWTGWWSTVACASATCSHLRHALLGPDAEELWQHVSFLDGPSHASGLHRLLRSQAHHARSALVGTGDGWPLADFAPCVAALTRLQELQIAYLSPAAAACLAAALGSSPASIACGGEQLWTCLNPSALEQLTHASLHYSDGAPLLAADVQRLAQHLPRLQELNLCVTLGPHQPAEALGLLFLLPATVLELKLDLELGCGSAVASVLQQLAGSQLQLHCLRISEGSEGQLTVTDERLLALCHIRERLVVCFRMLGRRLQQVPHAAVVQHEQPAPALYSHGDDWLAA